MSKVFLGFLCMMLSVAGMSQKVYFLYLQTEQEQSFYVRVNEKLYSSSGAGYLILPKLQDSTYQLTVGFPQNKWPEQKFSIAMRSKDHGYVLKNFGEKGWGLFDLQTLAVDMGVSKERVAATPTEKRITSVFTDILSKAADDSTIKERPVVVKAPEIKPPVESPKKEEVKAIVETKTNTDPVVNKPIVSDKPAETVVKKEEPVKTSKDPVVEKPVEKTVAPPVVQTPPTEDTSTSKPVLVVEPQRTVATPTGELVRVDPPMTEYKPSTVTRRAESSTTEGFGLTFVDEYADGTKDTIRILIPGTKPAAAQQAPVQEEKKFLEISTDNQAAIKPTTLTSCAEVAGEADFLKLRKNMAAAKDNDGMINEAQKYFKTKCFTTLQVKNLGTLFLTDAGKYRFFDTAYDHTSDPGNYASLQAELKEDYFINRFKAMIK